MPPGSRIDRAKQQGEDGHAWRRRWRCDPNRRPHRNKYIPLELSPGLEGVRELFRTMGPIDQTWTIEDVIAEGDKVVVRATNTCVQESFFGIPGRGRQQTFTATFIHRVSDGNILETWRNADDFGRLLQLGARIEPGTSEQ